jgi:hypothetical protein
MVFFPDNRPLYPEGASSKASVIEDILLLA